MKLSGIGFRSTSKMAAQSYSQGSSHQKGVWVIEFPLFVCKGALFRHLNTSFQINFQPKLLQEKNYSKNPALIKNVIFTRNLFLNLIFNLIVILAEQTDNITLLAFDMKTKKTLCKFNLRSKQLVQILCCILTNVLTSISKSCCPKFEQIKIALQATRLLIACILIS